MALAACSTRQWPRSDDRRLAAVFPVPANLEERVRAMLRKHPELGYAGACDVWDARHRRDRKRLLEMLPSVQACLVFLQDAPVRKDGWGSRDSYSFKHRVEEWTARIAGHQLGSIPQGAFVMAALLLGIECRRQWGTADFLVSIYRHWQGPSREALIERGVILGTESEGSEARDSRVAG